MIEGIDYCLLYPKNDKDKVHIRVLSGPYKDTVFHYGKVTFRENMDTMHLIFAFYVLESPVMKRKKLEKNTDFKKYAGDLLMEIMSANIDEDIIDEIGNNNTEESDI